LLFPLFPKISTNRAATNKEVDLEPKAGAIFNKQKNPIEDGRPVKPDHKEIFIN